MFNNRRLSRWTRRIFILLIIIIIIIGIDQFILKKSKALTQNDTDHTDEEEVKINTKELSGYPGLHLRTETKETDTYTLSIHMPFTDSEAINESIEQWIDEQKKAFVENVTQQTGNAENRAHLNIQLETKKVTKQIYSLIFSSEHYTDHRERQTFIKPFTIDIKNKQIIDINDMIDVQQHNLLSIHDLIIDELKKDETLHTHNTNHSLQELTKDPQEWKWSISNRELTLYFDQDEMTTETDEPIKVNIPIKEIRPYLKEDIITQLQLPKKTDQSKEFTPEIRELDPDGKYVALTFDDGPHPDVTPHVLDTLKQHEARATFFMLGNQVEYYPKIVEQVAKNGHEIGSHSNSHPDLTRLSVQAIQQELNETNEKIEQTVGMKPKLFRPPYGAFDEDVIYSATDYDHSMILWSVDSLDWKNRNTSSVQNTILNNITPGAIVLMHDIHPSTAEALPQILDTLTNEGYEFVTVSELLTLHQESGVGPFYGKKAY